LEGTIIHKSGLMTGGRSTHNTGKKWEEKDYQGPNIYISTVRPS
jgi:structural maintenance of chromosome 1